MGHPPLTYVGEKKHLDRNQILLAKKTGELDMEEANNKCPAFWLRAFIGAFILQQPQTFLCLMKLSTIVGYPLKPKGK